MVKERVCDCCNVKTKTILSDFHEIGWKAFQVPAGNGKVYCFCPNCQLSRLYEKVNSTNYKHPQKNRKVYK